MTGVVVPMPGWAIHVWHHPGGWFGVEMVRGAVDPDFPPEGAPLFEGHDEALQEASLRQQHSGLPIISHVEGR